LNVLLGFSYRATPAYEIYVEAIARRAEALGVRAVPQWLAGTGLEAGPAELSQLDGVLFTGGADVDPARYRRPDATTACGTIDPLRDVREWEILGTLQGNPKPVLAICRGAQLLNVFYGGTLTPDLGTKNALHRGRKDALHPIEIEKDSILARICGLERGEANSSHHQAVEHLATDFVVNARAGDGTIEGYEPRDRNRPFMLAVQWHPEAMPAGLPLADRVLDAFILAAVNFSNRIRGKRR
jgi:putative glutamine amidotransferase